MKQLKTLGFLTLAALLVVTSGYAQRANTGKSTRSGLTSTGMATRTIAPSLTYQTATAKPDSVLGYNGTHVGYTDIDFDAIDVRCKNLVGQALKTYCLENECSESSNTYIVSQSLPLDRTIATLNTYKFDSPATSESRTYTAGTYVYNSSVVAMCSPYIVNLVEAYIPSNYSTVTDACHEQYGSAIDKYCQGNQGCYKIKNFQILEYMKKNSTQDYMNSITNPTASGATKYFFTDYCMNKLADKIRLSLINLYMPDYKEWQRGMCRRAYQNAMSEYCENDGCMEELSLTMMLNNDKFNSYVNAYSDNINCNKELTQDVKDTLIEEMVKLENACIREGAQYNASKNQCQWTIVLRDDSNIEIDRLIFDEGQTLKCNDDVFIDPFSKKGRERAGKKWIATEEAAKTLATGGGAITGGIIGFNVGKRIDDNIWLKDAITTAIANSWDAGGKGNVQKVGNNYYVLENVTTEDGSTIQTTTTVSQEEYSVSQDRKKLAEKFSDYEIKAVRNALNRKGSTYQQIVDEVEFALWKTRICKKSPTCSAAILVRTVFDVTPNYLRQIKFNEACTMATLFYGNGNTEYLVLSAPKEGAKCPDMASLKSTLIQNGHEDIANELTVIDQLARTITTADYQNNLNKPQDYDKDVYANSLKVIEGTRDAESTAQKFEIDWDNLNILTVKFAGNKSFSNKAVVGKAVGTTVGAVGLGAAAFGITSVVYNSKYDKVACYSTFQPKSGAKNARKEIKKADWGGTYTFPKISVAE